jgi:phosphatidylglycerophosphate synthase
MTKQGIDTGGRVLNSLLAQPEKRVLTSLARGMPAGVKPDHLTAVGVAGALVAFAGYVLSVVDPNYLWLASLGLVINWFGDSLDGTLARVRKIERPRYGFFLDHTTDLASQALIAFGLGLSPYVRFDVACVVLISYYIAAAFAFVRRIVSGTLGIAYLGVGPTEVRLGILVLNASMYFFPPLPVLTVPVRLSSADLVVLAAAALTIIAVFVAALREWQRLAREDPLQR